MVSKEYLGTARTLFRIAKNITNETIAGRIRALAQDYERRAEKAELAEAAKALAPVAVRSDAVGGSNSR